MYFDAELVTTPISFLNPSAGGSQWPIKNTRSGLLESSLAERLIMILWLLGVFFMGSRPVFC